MSEEKKKTIPEMSIDTQMLCRRLEKCAVGELVTYDEMSQLVGGNILERRHIIQSARRWVQKNREMYFIAVSKTGLKRADDATIASLPAQIAERNRRAARRGMALSACIQDYNALTEQVKTELDAGRTRLALEIELGRRKRVEQIEEACRSAREALPPMKILELFG